MQTTLRAPLRLFGLLACLALISAAVTLLFIRLFPSPKEWRHDEAAGHHWLHQQLDLTAEEARRVDAFEEPYRADRQRHQAELARRIAALADILRRAEDHGPEVVAAVEAVHEVHGQIQTLAIAHYFEMLSVLPIEKQERLRALAVEALSHPH